MAKPVPAIRLIEDDFLSKDDRTSPVWQRLRERLQAMLAQKRIENDNPKLDHDSRQALLGHIELLKAFIALGKEPPTRVATVPRPTARPDYGAKYG